MCTSKGRWCDGRWFDCGALCRRAAKVPDAERHVTCPELSTAAVTVAALVEHLAANDETDSCLVVVAGKSYTARALAKKWRSKPAPAPDALEYAGETGRCAACGWRCCVCTGPDSVRHQPPQCRALSGRCMLAEQHAVTCSPELVHWTHQLPSVGKALNVRLVTQRDRPAKPAHVSAVTASSRKRRRRVVRRWARTEAKRLRSS